MTESKRPKIYLYCVPIYWHEKRHLDSGLGIVHGSTRGGDVAGYALTEDGTSLASHLSSSIDFSKHDMGLNSNWKHDVYGEHYPDGYELEWVDDLDSHEGFKAALEENHRKKEVANQAAKE